MRHLKLLGLLVGGLLIACDGGGGTGGNAGSGGNGGNGGTGNDGGGGNATGGGGNATGGTGGSTGGSGGTGGSVACTDPIDCDDGDVCTTDDCVNGSCSNVAIDVDDGDLCTTDTCDTVLGPVHTPVNIDDNDACTTDACDPLTGVSHTAVVIDDNNACTDDACDAVGGVTHTPVVINDNNACTTDACNQQTGVSHTPINPADNNICTIDTCFPASGQVNLGEISIFFEDFADNSAGWTLNGEWEIGAATASPPFNGYDYGWQNVPLSDPATDHTPTADNGVAGVVIGGNAAPVLHGFDYIESPAIDISTVPAGAHVEMRFWRWLNSDYDPYMHNTVEVYDGANWVTLPGWPTGGPPIIQDTPPVGNGWFLMSYDVTAYANANFRMRWGFDITSGGVYTIGSWNLDDVEVAYVAYTPSADQCKIEGCNPAFGTVLSDYPNNDNDPNTVDVCDPLRGPHHEFNPVCGNPGGGNLKHLNGAGTGVYYCYNAADSAQVRALKACESHFGVGQCSIISGGYQSMQYGKASLGGGAGSYHFHWDNHPAGHCAPDYVIGDVVSPGWCGVIMGNFIN